MNKAAASVFVDSSLIHYDQDKYKGLRKGVSYPVLDRAITSNGEHLLCIRDNYGVLQWIHSCFSINAC